MGSNDYSAWRKTQLETKRKEKRARKQGERLVKKLAKKMSPAELEQALRTRLHLDETCTIDVIPEDCIDQFARNQERGAKNVVIAEQEAEQENKKRIESTVGPKPEGSKVIVSNPRGKRTYTSERN